MIVGHLGVSYVVTNPCIAFGITCICKTSIVIRTSGNLVAILHFENTSTSHETGSTTTRKFDPENIGVAVGILSPCALELEICLGVKHILKTELFDIAYSKHEHLA